MNRVFDLFTTLCFETTALDDPALALEKVSVRSREMDVLIIEKEFAADAY